MRQSVTYDDVIEFLNELLEIDAEAVKQLVESRVPCKMLLAEHPTVQVRAQDDEHWVGLLGILNGLFGTYRDGCGPIAVCYEEFEVVGFTRTRPKAEVRCRELEDVLRQVQWTPMGGYKQSSVPTCVGCGAKSHGALSTEPHKPDCPVNNVLKGGEDDQSVE